MVRIIPGGEKPVSTGRARSNEEPVLSGVPQGDVRNGLADRDLQHIWNPQKNMQIFHRCYSIGTSTNKANISI